MGGCGGRLPPDPLFFLPQESFLRHLIPLLLLALPSLAEDPPVAVITTSMGEIRVLLYADEAPKTVENFLGLAEGTKEWKDAAGETVKRPFYDGLTFHRVISGFMIQGGCPKGDGTGDPGYKFGDEISAKSLGFDKIKVITDGQPGHQCLQIGSREDFQRVVVMPLFEKLGIKSQEDLEKRMDEVQKKIDALTVKEALENLGYTFDDTRASHVPTKGSLAMANSGPNSNGSQFFLNLADTPWLTGRHTVFGEVVGGMDVLEAIGAVKVGPDSRPIAEVKIVSIRRLPPEEAAKTVAAAQAAKAKAEVEQGSVEPKEGPGGTTPGRPATEKPEKTPEKPEESETEPAKPPE